MSTQPKFWHSPETIIHKLITKQYETVRYIEVKERSADENKQLKQYSYKLNKIESNIIQYLLKKFPEEVRDYI